MKIKFVLVLVGFSLVLVGCVDPGRNKATIRPEEIFGAPKRITLGLCIEGQKTFVVHRTASALEFSQYTMQLQRGFALPPKTKQTIYAYVMFRRALETGTRSAFDRVIPMKNLALIPAEADYILLVKLTEADGRQDEYYGYSSIRYRAELRGKTGHVCASTTGASIRDSYYFGDEALFVQVREACGTACKTAALEVINWTCAQLDKQ